jgi:hypothetical protein
VWTTATKACGYSSRTFCYPQPTSEAERHFRARIFSAASGNSALKKFFQNGILLLTGLDLRFYNRPRNWWWVAERGGGDLRDGEHMQLRLQTNSEGGLYGSKESWQDQKESACEEESWRQEEEVSKQHLLEAIH